MQFDNFIFKLNLSSSFLVKWLNPTYVEVYCMVLFGMNPVTSQFPEGLIRVHFTKNIMVNL